MGYKLIDDIIIPLIDFAYWPAQNKAVNGKALILPSAAETKAAMGLIHQMALSANT